MATMKYACSYDDKSKLSPEHVSCSLLVGMVGHEDSETTSGGSRRSSTTSANSVKLLPVSEMTPESQSDRRRVKAYHGMGASWGLSNMLANEDVQTERRVFLLDNSGSTSQGDGHIIRTDDRCTPQLVSATRWQEICSIAKDQANWNAVGGVHTEFHLLNPPCPNNPIRGRDFAVVDPKEGNVQAQLQTLNRLLQQNGPRGPTPLTQRLQQLRQRLQTELKDGERVMLSIVTDGLPTSPDCGTCTERDKAWLVQELRVFAGTFNCFIVIRLATDDDDAVAFYGNIDEEVELPMDIIDDLNGEAQELNESGNGWFAYTPLIHRIREGGTLEKLLDVLDERPLLVPEIAMLMELLFRGPDDAAFPRTAKELFKVAESINASAEPVFNGRLAKMTPPIDLGKLKKALALTTSQRIRALPSRMMRRARNMFSA
eukprot:TRINITY_DN87_c0_g1_i1.p1 TRINITY_DN87_c0_g1~~TRINITY_DN87_c0_g1_i1.p1  ORF type:complete len:449 (-),score=91.66 TRINITY_DN87_c0_g1_i1:569-1855(-)